LNGSGKTFTSDINQVTIKNKRLNARCQTVAEGGLMPDTMNNQNKMNEAIDLVASSKQIIVFTGAGISTSSGIPDFRSEKGLYSFVKQKYALPYPEAIFDIDYFKMNPGPFFDLSREMFSDSIAPSPAHKFVAWLGERGQIALVMTQNIDMLHSKAGSKNVIECHGSSLTGHCMACRKKLDHTEFEADIKEGRIPHCECGGIIKPDIVFFGENLPSSFFAAFNHPPKCDLLIIMGTSLTIHPAASFPLAIARSAKTIMVNRDETEYDLLFDYVFHMDTDIFAKQARARMEGQSS
jgi:NAD-dependent SIR2 family protein deacetylase